MTGDLLTDLLSDLNRWGLEMPGPENVARVQAAAWARGVHGDGAVVLIDPLPTVRPWHLFDVTVVRLVGDRWITLDGVVWRLSEADVKGARAAVAEAI